MTFRVGQKVVCVNARGNRGLPWAVGSELVNGSVYTVRACGVTLNGGQGLLLCEVNLVVFTKFRLIGLDCFYDANRFRPVVERKTDIAIFTRMLNPQQENV